MGSGRESLFHKRKAPRKNRDEEIRELRAVQWLIVCEGFTEQHYFKALIKSLNMDKDSIRTVGEGHNTTRLVDKVDNYFDSVDKICGKQHIPYNNERIVFVFDKDDFSANNFNNAIKMAEDRYPGCTVAWSNESFELWLCLHFDYVQSPLHRGAYNDKLTEIFRKNGIFNKRQSFDYNGKNDAQLYEKINQCGGSLDNAIKWSKRLADSQNLNNPAKANPVTMVYKAVQVLREEFNVSQPT
ncbi:MAG: RloB family protein [Defluviitaleaceae bacterium]|nr:RloB family protein [Defluviitaleaceae bacterium]